MHSLSLLSLAATAAAGATQFNGIPTVGVLYSGSDPKSHHCSASVIQSKVGNVILTAGHCIGGSGKGQRFAPGYHDGETPYGTYPVTGAYVHPLYNKNLDINYDFAFLTLGEGAYKGKTGHVQAHVGANKLVTNAGYSNSVEVVGTPSASHQGGHPDKPWHCHGQTLEAQAGQMRFNCGPFDDGTSGSPWIANYDVKTNRGNVIGNIGGLKQGGCSAAYSFSPKYGQGTLDTFNRANAGKPADNVRGGRNDC